MDGRDPRLPSDDLSPPPEILKHHVIEPTFIASALWDWGCNFVKGGDDIISHGTIFLADVVGMEGMGEKAR